MANFVSGIEQEQDINIEKAKIILGEEFVRRQLEANPNAPHSFHLSEPYKSMSLVIFFFEKNIFFESDDSIHSRLRPRRITSNISRCRLPSSSLYKSES